MMAARVPRLFKKIFGGQVHLGPATDERCVIMNCRISLALLLGIGCSSTQNNDTGGNSGTSGGSDSNSGASQGSGTAQMTDATPTEGVGATEGSSGETEDAGGQSASQAGTSTGAVDESTSSSTSGDTSTSSGDQSTSSSSSSESSSGESSGSSSTGDCMVSGDLKVVDLGSSDDPKAAGNYALLAKTAITNVTGSAIAGGDVGLSPAAATFITGFSMMLHPSGKYSTSDSVVAPWKIYAANYAVPTPANLTSAVSSMQTAYTDAAGRPGPDFLDLKSGNLGGLTLEPGLYTWGSTVLIPNDVTISGCPDDVWIFQIANDLDVSAAKKIILSGGARAENIFWQVAGQVTIHSNAHFEGVILSKTGITLQTNATLHGRALAQSMIALDNNKVTAP